MNVLLLQYLVPTTEKSCLSVDCRTRLSLSFSLLFLRDSFFRGRYWVRALTLHEPAISSGEHLPCRRDANGAELHYMYLKKSCRESRYYHCRLTLLPAVD